MGGDFDTIASAAIPLLLCAILCFGACYGIRRHRRERAKVIVTPKRALVHAGSRVYIV